MDCKHISQHKLCTGLHPKIRKDTKISTVIGAKRLPYVDALIISCTFKTPDG